MKDNKTSAKTIQEHTALLEQAQGMVFTHPSEARKLAKSVFSLTTETSMTKLRWRALTIIVRTFVGHRVISRQSQRWIHLAQKELPIISTADAPELLLQLANFFMISNNFSEAELFYERAFQKFTDSSNSIPIHAYLNRAHTYLEFEQYEKGWQLLCSAEQMLLEAMRSQPTSPNALYLQDMLVYTLTLTVIYFLHVEDFYSGEQYIHRSIAICNTPELLARKGYLYALLLNILLRRNELTECDRLLTEMYNISLQTKQPMIAVDVHLGYAYLRRKQGKLEDALAYAKKAFRVVRKTKEKYPHLHVIQQIAEILVEMDNIDEAEKWLTPYLSLPYSTKMRRFLLRATYIRAQIALIRNDTVTASALLQEYIEGLKKPGIELLRHKFHVIRERELGTFGHDELIAKHSLQRQNLIPKPKPKEFPPSAPNAFRQFDVLTSNEYLNAIRSTLVDLLHNADTLNHKTIKAKIKSVQQLIETNYNEQDMLFAVEREIQHVHKDFIEKLSFTYPSLSHTEIRVCLLLRLNLNTHQIAAMMNISPATVFTHRKHIRKKMGITRNDNLSILLMQLSGLRVEG